MTRTNLTWINWFWFYLLFSLLTGVGYRKGQCIKDFDLCVPQQQRTEYFGCICLGTSNENLTCIKVVDWMISCVKSTPIYFFKSMTFLFLRQHQAPFPLDLLPTFGNTTKEKQFIFLLLFLMHSIGCQEKTDSKILPDAF